MIQVQVRTWAVVRDRAIYALFVVGLCGLTACQEEGAPEKSDVPPTAFGGAEAGNDRARAAVEVDARVGAGHLDPVEIRRGQ